jgi:ribosomal protein S21
MEIDILVEEALKKARRAYSLEMMFDPRRPWRNHYRKKLAEERKKIAAWANYQIDRVMRDHQL